MCDWNDEEYAEYLKWVEATRARAMSSNPIASEIRIGPGLRLATFISPPETSEA